MKNLQWTSGTNPKSCLISWAWIWLKKVMNFSSLIPMKNCSKTHLKFGILSETLKKLPFIGKSVWLLKMFLTYKRPAKKPWVFGVIECYRTKTNCLILIRLRNKISMIDLTSRHFMGLTDQSLIGRFKGLVLSTNQKLCLHLSVSAETYTQNRVSEFLRFSWSFKR